MNIIQFFNSLPHKLFIFGEYSDAKANNWKEFTYWWRQLFHCLGGFLLALTFSFLSPSYAVLGVSAFIAGKECEELTAGFKWKSLVDWAAWTLGACLILIG